jgi:hypothetical protein
MRFPEWYTRKQAFKWTHACMRTIQLIWLMDSVLVWRWYGRSSTSMDGSHCCLLPCMMGVGMCGWCYISRVVFHSINWWFSYRFKTTHACIYRSSERRKKHPTCVQYVLIISSLVYIYHLLLASTKCVHEHEEPMPRPILSTSARRASQFIYKNPTGLQDYKWRTIQLIWLMDSVWVWRWYGRSSTSMDGSHCCPLPCMGVAVSVCVNGATYLASSSIQLIDDSSTVSRPHMHAYIGRRKGEKTSNVCTVRFNNFLARLYISPSDSFYKVCAWARRADAPAYTLYVCATSEPIHLQESNRLARLQTACRAGQCVRAQLFILYGRSIESCPPHTSTSSR